jgi:serine/threonine protein kinase
MNIFHSDIEPGNIIIDIEGKCYLADLGGA